MSEHPPPAPDWIMGDDGHWKPPPFDLGGRRSAPTGPPTGPVPPPPGPPPGGWAPPPGGAPGWPPPPSPAPSSSPSAGRIVAVVLGGLAVAGVAVVGVLLTAVTFLGTTSEPRFERVGPPDTGPVDLSDPTAPTPTTEARVDDVPRSEAASVVVAEELAERDWIPTDGEPIEVDQDALAGTCAVAGWLTGAVDRFRSYHDRPGGPVTDALTLSVTAYSDVGAARAELERNRSQAYQDCEVSQHRDEFGTEATVTTLAEDPQAPGVAYQVSGPGGTRVEYDITVFVGELRAHLDFCGCADLGGPGQRAVARQVAAALAAAQGLPAPG